VRCSLVTVARVVTQSVLFHDNVVLGLTKSRFLSEIVPNGP